jgi:branched-chain amino acid transport system ATP-binding protein
MGLTPPQNGVIRFKGEQTSGNPAYVMAKKGIAYMPDDLRIFPDLTCEENLEIARRLSGRSGYWNRERVEALFPVLSERPRQMGLNLSGGEKKMLSMGRALMANPDLVLLDEPSEGLAPMVVSNLVEVISNIQKKGMTILLADQNLKFCRRVCQRGYIIEKGRIVHEDTMEAIWSDEKIIQKYLVV